MVPCGTWSWTPWSLGVSSNLDSSDSGSLWSGKCDGACTSVLCALETVNHTAWPGYLGPGIKLKETAKASTHTDTPSPELQQLTGLCAAILTQISFLLPTQQQNLDLLSVGEG